MAIRGSVVTKAPFWGEGNAYEKYHKGDEYLLTKVISKDLNMPILIATRAIAAHFAYHGEREKVLRSDVLDRYRSLANEFYCSTDNYLARWGDRLGPHHVSSPKVRPDGNTIVEGVDEAIGDGPQDIINGEALEQSP